MFNAVNEADRYFMRILCTSFVLVHIILLGVKANSVANSPCGGVLNQSQGFIQTPNFPGKFKVPIKCKWVIDASSHLPNATLTVHLTQLYVTTGLRFTGLPYYDPENTFALGEKFGESPVHNVSENNVLTVNWLKTDSQFLAVYFELNQLEGNHIRALDNLLDVYGFNITYQVRNGLVGANSTCSAVGCSYNGHCFASHNYSEYRCSCFHGFSGKDCGQGPLCRSDRNPCMNNGTCRHVGSSSVICNCPASYTGSKCEIAVQLPSSDCPEDGGKKTECVNYCPVRQHETPCSCRLRPVKEVSERSRYQIGIQTTSESMENSSSRDHLKPISSRTSSHQFEKSITKYLKGRISSFEALKILNISFDGEILFHVFARNEDEDNIKQSIGEMVEQAALDNFTFTSATFNFKREPALFVEEVSVSPDRRSVRHGDEFIITCTAYGSQHITFRWFKNDILINITKATREMSIIDAPNHLLDHYTSMLTVKSADPLDRGLYTCQAIDWGAQHCKSVKLDVISAPGVKVAPLTASIQKGQALNIICTWSMTSDDSKLFYGYSWLKERKDTSEAHLFKMKEDSEVWEDLQPVGSILRVYNIQKSTRYTCQVQSNAEPVEASVDVEVLNKSAIPWCESDDTGVGGVRWAEIGAWGAAKVECPARYSGVATRLCSVSAPGKAAWLTPDYSNCISEDLSRLAENFKKSTLGYGSTTGAYTMSKIYELLRDRSRLYPGEGETFLTLMQDVAWYLNFTMAWKDLLQSTPAFYNTINIILQHSNSIINSQKLIDLQNLVNHWTITWAKHSRINRASVQSYDSLMIHTYCFNSSSNKLEYTFDVSGNIRGYQSWSRTAVNILVARESLLVHGSTYSIAIIIYKDLMKYLPERQIYKMDDGSEWEVEQTSGNVVSLVGSSPSLQVMVDIRMATALRQGWNMSCGAMTAPSARWMLEKCTVTIDIEASVTRCTCPMLATITALLTKTALQNGKKSTAKSDVVLILGCLCCILQCVLSTALLLMRWYNNPSCLIFLKLQCCISVTAIAMVFFSAARSDIKESSYPVFVFSLEAFFLLGLSSHLTKLLLVYTEIIYLPTVKDMKLTVVGVINGFTLLIVLCNHLSYNSTRWRMESWWLIKGTFVFYAFVICISVMSAMFLFLYLSVMKRLAQLSSMKSISKEQTKAIKKRVCLLGRAALLFITILVMALMSIVYVNYPGLKSQYAFSLTCAFTGFVLLACYVLQSEAPLHLHLMEKIGAKDVCTSDSESNILNFFTKQDGETESECAPPQPSKEPPTCQKESIQLREISPRGLSPLSKEKATSNTKLVTFQSDLVQGCEVLKYASTLPKRRPKLTITRSESISNISGITSLDQFGNEHHVTTSSTHRSLDVGLLQSNHDVLTTRVCVELGLVTNGDKHHTINEGPSIVLCSVDIEPCPGKVVELNEVTVKTTTTDVNGNGSSNSLTVANMNISRQTQNVCSNRAFENNLSQLDNENGNCIESVQEASRTDRDVLNRISSDLQYLLQDYDANGNANNKTVQGEQGIIVRSSVEDDKNEENCSEGKTSL